MSNLPIRNIGSVGVVTDTDPFNLPFNAFTRGKNIRFSEGNVERAPIFREVKQLSFDPVFCMGLTAPGSYSTILMVSDDLNIYEYANSTYTQVYTNPLPSSSIQPITGTTLANVEYINRPDNAPLHRGPNQTTFSPLVNWPSGYTCGSLRSYGDFLIAMNTTEGGIDFPNRVRFSDLVVANQVPSTWDELDTTNSAGFNDLVQMKTPIIDGATLGTNFLIYSSDQVWQMEFVGGTFIFNFRKVFDDAGVINKNCIVEVEGRHYVFDNDDIYVNDGVTRQSIADRRVRDYVFKSIDRSKTDQCFVLHNTSLEEIYFCYHSGDDMAIRTDSDACNRAAVFNYRENVWSFMDLPNAISGTSGTVGTVLTFASVPAGLTYANAGGTYHEQESQYNMYPLMVSRQNNANGITVPRLVGIDNIDKGFMAFPYEDEINSAILLERVGIDLDEAQIPLSGYKVITKVYPQASATNNNTQIAFEFGAANYTNELPNYGPQTTFDIQTGYKIDTRASGRYLSYRINQVAPADFTFSGFDVDITVTGRR